MVMSAAKKHKWDVLSLEQKLEIGTSNNCSTDTVTALAHTPHPETPQQQVFSAVGNMMPSDDDYSISPALIP